MVSCALVPRFLLIPMLMPANQSRQDKDGRNAGKGCDDELKKAPVLAGTRCRYSPEYAREREGGGAERPQHVLTVRVKQHAADATGAGQGGLSALGAAAGIRNVGGAVREEAGQ